MKPTEIGITVEQEVSRMPSYEEATILYSPASLEAAGKWLAAMAQWYEDKGEPGAKISTHMMNQLSKQLRYASEKMNDG